MRRRTAAVAIALVLVGLWTACASGDGDGGGPSGVSGIEGEPLDSETTPATTAESGVTDAPTPSREPRLVSLDWLAGDVSVPGLEGGVAAPAVDAGLQTAVVDALAGFEGGASVVVHHLGDGRYAAVNEAQVWYAASTFKAAVLLEAYRQRDSGELDFDKLVTLEEKYAENDLGTLEYLELEPGDQLTVRDAVKGMIVVSDTSLALLMIDQLNSNRIDETLDSVGATVMTVNDTALPTTALDLAQLMIAIAAGQGVSPASRDEMLSLLAQEWFTQGIIAGLPSGTTYAHKSGSFTDAVHDAAIVWGPSGPYVIVVMTDGSNGWDPIAAVSSAVWHYFEGN
ncbi:MAG: serine hydrolase [Thermomicrobiales bacterium]